MPDYRDSRTRPDHRKSRYRLVEVDNSQSPPNPKSPTSHRRNGPKNTFPRLATRRNRKYASFYVRKRPLPLPRPPPPRPATPSKRPKKKIEFPLFGSVFRLCRSTDSSDRHRTSSILTAFSRPTFLVLIDFPVRPLLSRQIGRFSEKFPITARLESSVAPKKRVGQENSISPFLLLQSRATRYGK